MKRREILRTGSLGTLGLFAAKSIQTARAQGRTIGANDRIRIGIVGFSDRLNSTLLPAYKAVAAEFNCEIVGVSDIWNRRRDEAKAYFKKHFNQDIETYRNNEELYEKAKPDAVIISTADFQHAVHAVEAIKAGCDVYCEKPFAETMEDARAALKAVKSSDRILQIGSQRRSGANYAAAHDFLKSGKFGPIVAAEMTWNVNQPGRWRRPDLVASIKEEDTDWKRYLCNRPEVKWDPRKYLEYRLFWPYSSGIPGQWMCHQIDTVHWFTGLPHPRSVAANGGIYQWKDGRTNFDTLTAVFDYGPLDDPTSGFQVNFSSRFSNSAGGTKEIYYSNGGELNLDTNKVTSNGGMTQKEAAAMKLQANLLEEFKLEGGGSAASEANMGSDPLTTAHMKNWLECLRSRKQPHAPVEAGYQHSIATIMANAAVRTGQRVTFDEKTQEVMAGDKIFHL
jgi:predicted dehydrogenase